jgi:hypothetical protein
MPGYGPPAVDDAVYNILVRLVYLVYVQVEIVIDDIAGGSNKNGSDDKPDQPGKIGRRLVNREINTIIEEELGECNKEQVRPTDQT